MLSGRQETVVFNVRGRHYEVIPELIRSRGSTLLANLIDDIGVDPSRAIFVDGNPERFEYILDWYHYGEMFVPSDCPIEALLRDARFFLLPDSVKINGELITVRGSVISEAHESLRRSVISRWPTFDLCVNRIIDDTKMEVQSLGARSDELDTDVLENVPCDCLSSNSSTSKMIAKKHLVVHREFTLAEVSDDIDSNLFELQSMAPMFMNAGNTPVRCGRWKWTDEKNVCNELRLRVLKSELERLGFVCTVNIMNVGSSSRLILRVEIKIKWDL
jgi:hypothetical protein